MKKWLKPAAVLLALVLVLACFAGCGKKTEKENGAKDADKTQNTAAAPTEPADTPTEPEPTEPEPTEPEPTEPAGPEDYLDVTGVDFSAPSIVIAADDFDGMKTFAKQMQNYEIPVGTIVEISGFVGPGMLMHTINVPNKDGSESFGTTYVLVGEAEYPPDETPIHLIGVVRMGEYYPLIVVPADLLKIVN